MELNLGKSLCSGYNSCREPALLFYDHSLLLDPDNVFLSFTVITLLANLCRVFRKRKQLEHSRLKRPFRHNLCLPRLFYSLGPGAIQPLCYDRICSSLFTRPKSAPDALKIPLEGDRHISIDRPENVVLIYHLLSFVPKPFGKLEHIFRQSETV